MARQAPERIAEPLAPPDDPNKAGYVCGKWETAGGKRSRGGMVGVSHVDDEWHGGGVIVTGAGDVRLTPKQARTLAGHLVRFAAKAEANGGDDGK